MSTNFTGNFTQQVPIPEEAIERAVVVMRSGRLHRYNVVDGEVPETVRLENEFAAYMGARFCLACTSGGYALQTALRAFGVSPGEPVLTNGFTLSPVPGAIAAAGGKAVLVEITDDLVIDIDTLKEREKHPSTWFRPQLEREKADPHHDGPQEWQDVGREPFLWHPKRPGQMPEEMDHRSSAAGDYGGER